MDDDNDDETVSATDESTSTSTSAPTREAPRRPRIIEIVPVRIVRIDDETEMMCYDTVQFSPQRNRIRVRKRVKQHRKPLVSIHAQVTQLAPSLPPDDIKVQD